MPDISLKKIEVLSLIFLLVLTAGAWLIMSWPFAQSVLAGGAIAIASFFAGHRDIDSFLKTFEPPANGKPSGKKEAGRSRYIIKFWLRLGLIGVVLFFFIKSGKADIIGLLLGLSTVVIVIFFTALTMAGRYFFSRKG